MDAEIIEELGEAIEEAVKSISEIAFSFDVGDVVSSDTTLPECPVFVGLIHILGDWNGSVTVEMSRNVADRVIENVLQETEIDDLKRKQFLQEFVNMTGGNLKPLLGEKCILSTPKSYPANGYKAEVVSSEEIKRVVFVNGEDHLVVRLFDSIPDILEEIKSLS